MQSDMHVAGGPIMLCLHVYNSIAHRCSDSNSKEKELVVAIHYCSGIICE